MVWRDQRLLLLVTLLTITAFPLVTEALAVPYAADLGAGPAAVGLLLAAGPAGSFAGMLINNRWSPASRLRLMPWLAVAGCLVLLPCALQPGVVPTLGLWLLSGMAVGAYFITANAEFVRRVPDSQRGQVFGLAATVLRVVQGLAVVIAGLAADALAPAAIVAVSGAVGAAAAGAVLVVWRSPVTARAAAGDRAIDAS